MEYVVKTRRLRDYLYCLGFNYRQVPDKTNKQEFIWLFENNELLQDAIIYYSNHKKKMIEMKKKENWFLNTFNVQLRYLVSLFRN